MAVGRVRVVPFDKLRVRTTAGNLIELNVSLYDIYVGRTSRNIELLQELAEFRYRLRRFLLFSEEAAARMELPAQQHQLLLQVAGAPEGTEVTVAYAAERLGLRHHSVVELSKRCSAAGLISRKHDRTDGRRVVLVVTAKGQRVLRSLSEDHARELHDVAPELLRALLRVQDAQKKDAQKGREAMKGEDR